MKNLLKIFGLWALVLFCTGVSAQDKLVPVSDSQKEAVVKTISNSSRQMNTVSCDFEQIKTISILNSKLVSTGKMYYSTPDKLRWEYKSPYTYLFIINSSKVVLKSNNQENVIDIKQSKLFEEISKIMINSITGKSLANSDDFTVSLFTADKNWVVKLVPKKKELKQLFSNIFLYFDKEKVLVSKVVLVEKGRDETVISLKNVKVNESISNKIFDL